MSNPNKPTDETRSNKTNLKEINIGQSRKAIDSVSNKEKEMINEYGYIIDAVASILYAKKKLPPSIDYHDLHSVGFYGLLKAIRGFKKEKDAQFKTYANIRVRGEMLDLIRKEWRAKSSRQHNELLDKIKDRVAQVIDMSLENEKGKVNVKNLLSVVTTSYMVSLENVMETYGDNVADNAESIGAELELDDEYNTLNKILMDLPKEDVKFIELFYRKGISQKEISIQLNMSEATVSRMHHRIISELKSKIGNQLE